MPVSVTDIANAIARFENVAPKYNNPGALMDLDYYKQTGQFRLMTYPSYEAGYQALRAQILRDANRGYNFYEWIARYAPAGHGGNDPQHYANTIAGWLGVNPNVRVIDAIQGGTSISAPVMSNNNNLPVFATTVFGNSNNGLSQMGDAFMSVLGSGGSGIEDSTNLGMLGLVALATFIITR